MNKQEMIEANRKAGKQIFTVGDMAKAVKRDTVTPKINDKFRFDDGTIGTIVATEFKLGKQIFPWIIVASEKYGRCSFTIRSLTLYQAPVTSNAIWTVKGNQDESN